MPGYCCRNIIVHTWSSTLTRDHLPIHACCGSGSSPGFFGGKTTTWRHGSSEQHKIVLSFKLLTFVQMWCSFFWGTDSQAQMHFDLGMTKHSKYIHGIIRKELDAKNKRWQVRSHFNDWPLGCSPTLTVWSPFTSHTTHDGNDVLPNKTLGMWPHTARSCTIAARHDWLAQLTAWCCCLFLCHARTWLTALQKSSVTRSIYVDHRTPSLWNHHWC